MRIPREAGRPVPGPEGLVVISAMVLAFRIGAWLSPSRAISTSPALALPLCGLGLLFLACGVWAWWRRPTRLSRVFLLYGIGGAIHWGGAIAARSPVLEASLLCFYVAATAAGDGALLDLALRYPVSSRERGLRAMAPYLIGALMLLGVPVAPFLPQPALAAALSLGLLVAFGMSIAAGILFVVGWFRAARGKASGRGSTAIVAGLVVSTALDLAGESAWLPGGADAWKLGYAVVPMTLAWALTLSGEPRLDAAAAEPMC